MKAVLRVVLSTLSHEKTRKGSVSIVVNYVVLKLGVCKSLYRDDLRGVFRSPATLLLLLTVCRSTHTSKKFTFHILGVCKIVTSIWIIYDQIIFKISWIFYFNALFLLMWYTEQLGHNYSCDQFVGFSPFSSLIFMCSHTVAPYILGCLIPEVSLSTLVMMAWKPSGHIAFIF